MAGDQYQKEQKDFREKFSRLKGKAIALYGIGRRTMTLLPAIRDFHVIALLDRAKESIGKEIESRISSSSIPIRATSVLFMNASQMMWRFQFIMQMGNVLQGGRLLMQRILIGERRCKICRWR